MRKLALLFALFCIGAAAQNSPSRNSSDKTLEGCLLRQGPDLFLRPLSGNTALVHLSATSADELASHAGQRLRVHGSEQPPAKTPTASATQPVTPVEKQPAPSTLPSGTPDPNVPVTQLPQSAQAGEGTAGFRGNAPNRELYVSSFEPLAGSCKP